METASLAEIIKNWTAALMTLMIFSFLYKDNRFYKFAEHLFVGVSAAFWMVFGFYSTLVPNLLGTLFPRWTAGAFPEVGGVDPEAATQWFYVFPLILGILMLTRLIPKIAWLSRWSLAFIVGWAAGTNLTRFLQSDFIKQIDNTIQPIVVSTGDGIALGATLTSIVIVVGVISGLIYFFFSASHKGILAGPSRLGIWILMITFGASFGYTVMARVSLLTGRLDFLIELVKNPTRGF